MDKKGGLPGRQWHYGDATPKQHRARRFNWAVFVLAAMAKTLSLIGKHLESYVSELDEPLRFRFSNALRGAKYNIANLSKVIATTHHDVRIQEKENE